MADSYENSAKVLQKFLNQWIREMQQNLDTDRTNNSGELRQSLGKNFNNGVKVNPDLIVGVIEGTDYWGAVDEGRRPGKQPPLQDILKWVQTKLPRNPDISDNSLAYLIARKIGEEGTKPGTSFASKVLTDEAINELENAVADAMVEDTLNNLNL